jgi:type VI secretion system secreted protein Hcp
MYLKIDGIKGDATADKHKDEIEIFSFSFGVAQPSGGPHTSSGGHAGGRVIPSDFSFTHKVDTASPILYLGCCSGEVFKEAKLTMRRASKDQKVFMTYTFTNVIVSSVSPSGSTGGDDIPMEGVSLRFDSLTLEYTPIKSDGSEGAKAKAGWDFATNKKK